MNQPLVLSGRYELGELIGRGGMADVFEGRDLRLGRKVAVKMLRPDMARDRQFLARFEREARAVAGLNHPAIVAVFDTGEHVPEPGNQHAVPLPYIVMEFVDGKTLREIVRGDGLTIDDAVDYVLGVLGALDYSHRQGIIHRDIKPANVMCTASGEVKVMDFGIARATADSGATMTQTQAVVGTAQYLSPEQARGEVVDSRSDLYSAGCLLYELLTGRPPFVGDSPVSVAYQHVQTAPQPAAVHNPEVSPALESVLAKALEKDPAARFQNAAAFARALRAAKAGIPVAPAGVAAAGVAGAGVAGAGAGSGPDGGVDDGGLPTAPVGLVGLGVAGAAGAAGMEGATAAEGASRASGASSGDAGGNGAVATGAEETGRHAAPTHLGDTGQIPLAAAAPAPELIAFDDAADEERERRGRGKRRTWIVVLLLAALLLVGAGGLWLYNYMNQPAAVVSQTIPEVAGMNETEAALLLERQGFELAPIQRPHHDTVPKGIAIRTVPAAGTQLDLGKTVTLEVSDGPANATIPKEVIGASEAGARATLGDLGLKVKARTARANDPKAPYGTVVAVNPGVGQTVAIGSEVELTISTGKATVPDLRGKTYEEAAAALKALGLTAARTDVETGGSPAGTVIGQQPAPNGAVDQGGTVALTVAATPQPTPSPDKPSEGASGSPSAKPTADKGKGNP
ncbi:protein kinase domain-containing protein [Sinomonas halotolerans]|uniref:non-specific serine/threonine protein kinase n=1 Tax=Sinomonas halotolerans TaxID=1644133 RepID=A0ABU9X297_9MICC